MGKRKDDNTKKKKLFDPVNIHVGMRLRYRRTMKGLEQAELGYLLGRSPEQIQSYETGEKSISPPRLLQIANILDVSVGYFFDDLSTLPKPPSESLGLQQNKQILDLIRMFLTIKTEADRQYVLKTARHLSQAAL